MAKKGGKKGGKKKGGKKKKEEVAKDELSEVDREIYQLQIADLTRKVERLKARVLELESSNEELQKSFETLDEDRADIISYLKREVQKKTDEIGELQERIEGLQQAKDANTAQFTEKILQLEHDYKVMHEQLTSEIKLLSGKLNSLEEFRIQRDDLMKKFKEQEIGMENQDASHKEAMYEMERKFIVGKDKLKKEMESRLLQLSQDFQNTTQLRIAATTHRTIRENIALNNELNLMLEMSNQLRKENETMRDNDTKLRLGIELHKGEKNMAIAKNRIQHKLIENLTTKHESLDSLVTELQHKVNRSKILEQKLKAIQGDFVGAQHQIQALTKQLENSKCQQAALKMGTLEAESETKRLQRILRQTVKAVKDAVAIKKTPSSDDAFNVSRRESLLSNLLGLLNMANLPEESEIYLPDIYETGDLGLISKSSSIATAGSGHYSKTSLHKASSITLKSLSAASSAKSATSQKTASSAKSGSSVGSVKDGGSGKSTTTVKSKEEFATQPTEGESSNLEKSKLPSTESLIMTNGEKSLGEDEVVEEKLPQSEEEQP